MNFHMPVKVVFGSGVIESLNNILIDELKVEKTLIVTDKGIVNSGILDKVLKQTENAEVFDEIEANPKSDTVDKAGEIARKLKPDLIIGLGGGSPLDAAKSIALLATNEGEIYQYEGRRKYKNAPLPVLAIPTTCGTGSEVTWVSVITDVKRKFKMSIKGHEMFPVVALIDPDLLCSLPKGLIAATGLDALTHAVEAYTVKPATPFTDPCALKAIKLIAGSIKKAFENITQNSQARRDIMLGSTIAGIAFGNSDVGAVHCLSESIGALFDVPHGVANSIFLPHVMKFNLPLCVDKFADIAKLFGIKEKDNPAASEKLISDIKTLSSTLNIPSFRDLEIGEEYFQKIAEYSFQNNSNPSNPREAGINDYLDILYSTLKDN